MKLAASTWPLLLAALCMLPHPAFAQTAATDGSCVCDCVYLRNAKIKNHRYYDPGEEASCRAIEGMACIGELRGEQYRGRVQNCAAGPSQIDLPLSSWIQLRRVAASSATMDATAVQRLIGKLLSH